jgi:hypothetical protein
MKYFSKMVLFLVDFNENLKLTKYHNIIQIQREIICRKVYDYVMIV